MKHAAPFAFLFAALTLEQWNAVASLTLTVLGIGFTLRKWYAHETRNRQK
jgi:hypothetical protein